MRPRGVKVLSQCCQKIGDVAVTFTVGRVLTGQEMAGEAEAKPTANEPKEDRERVDCPETVKQKVRGLADLARAMPGVCGR